jgi:nucleotidyltransferase/DNA polymerase involved in DNA repair
MYMVGVSTVNNLRKNGINTIGDLANDSNLELLKRILNKN